MEPKSVKLCEVPIRCPTHKARLVRIPEPIAEDIVVCPDCGAGGTFEQVVEQGSGLIGGYVPIGNLQLLLKRAGYPGC